jgi:4-diphosphocytidyl-2-C-methyl-D-erythritol kinase
MTPKPEPCGDGNWWPAPAKLNLFLHITGRRPNGYHELQTLFQILDWGDEVFIRITDDGHIERRGADYDVTPEDDLAIRAAKRLQAAAGGRPGAQIEVRKRIPLGAGLGGGSSNAATVLTILNELWGCGFSVAALSRLGLELGADVPVFVHGNTAIATGVGEILNPVSLGNRYYLLVMPDYSISTAEVFADPQLKRDSKPISMAEAVTGGGRNDCEVVAKRYQTGLSDLFEELAEYGQPRLSGTGSAVFVNMPSLEAASSAAGELKCRYNVRAVGGLDQSPLKKALIERLCGSAEN